MHKVYLAQSEFEVPICLVFDYWDEHVFIWQLQQMLLNYNKMNLTAGWSAEKAICTKVVWRRFYEKRKLYDFAFEKQLVGHILDKIIVIWLFKPAPFY